MDDQVVFITSFVKEYDYPSVELMDEEELLQVFNASNRVFLLSWALSKLNPELYGYLPANQRQKDIKNIIAKALSDHGFCYENHSMQFVDGQLEVPENVTKLYILLKYKKNIILKTILGCNYLQVVQIHRYAAKIKKK